MMMTRILQPELSAAISNIKTPEEAMRDAAYQIRTLLRMDPDR
jgi:hypothetical protein